MEGVGGRRLPRLPPRFLLRTEAIGAKEVLVVVAARQSKDSSDASALVTDTPVEEVAARS